MKTTTSSKRVLASATLVSICGLAYATSNGKQFAHNDTMEKGRLIYREIYSMDNPTSGILSPVRMHKYSYDTDHQRTVKSIYTWSVFKNAQEKEPLMVVSRYETETSVEYSVWSKKKESLSSSEKYIHVTNSDNQLIAQYAYKMNSRTNQWIPEKDALVPTYENIYTTTR